jgi:hypothetical protein
MAVRRMRVRVGLLAVMALVLSLLSAPVQAGQVQAAEALPMGSLRATSQQVATYTAGSPGSRNVWNDGTSPFSVGMWDISNHYFLVPPGRVAWDVHGPISEWVSIRTVYFGPGSCARWY